MSSRTVSYTLSPSRQINETALHFAAMIGHKALTEQLLRRGADANAKDNVSANTISMVPLNLCRLGACVDVRMYVCLCM